VESNFSWPFAKAFVVLSLAALLGSNGEMLDLRQICPAVECLVLGEETQP
jgi:hypothetical protein